MKIEVKKLRSYESGFTLIEVLISLTILTIVLGAVYSSFFSVQRAIKRFDDISLKYHDARTALDIMRREIEGALIKNPAADEKKKIKAGFVIQDRDIFGKNASVLNLTAFSFKGNDLNAVSYFVLEQDSKFNLMKSESAAAGSSIKYKTEIIGGIESFTVETLYNKEWVRTWDTQSTAMLPEIVRISIEFDDNGRLVRLIEYARPKVGTRL